MMCGAWHATTTDAVEIPPGELRGCLSRATSLYLLASITASYLASSSAPTPLYPIYQGEWGFSAMAISFVFGIYAISVLGALLVAVRLSDYFGRRPELIPQRAGAMASLRPRFGLPAATRQPILIAAPVLIAVWALAGFYGSLGPSLVRTSFELDSSLAGGIALFVLAGSGGTSVLLTQRLSARTLMLYGPSVLLAGVGLALASLSYHSPTAFFLGTALAGSGFGTGFQGAIRTVVPLAGPQERGGVLSVIFVVSYLAMGLPAVIAGYFVARSGDLFLTAREFGAVVMALAALALMGTLLRTSRRKELT